MQLLLSILLIFAAATLCRIDANPGDGFDDGDDFDETAENNELMRRLSSSAVKLPINVEEIRGLQYLYNSTNGDYWSWNVNDTYTYGIPWNFTANLSLVNPCYDHWQGILCSCNTSYTLYPRYYYHYYYYYDDVSSYPIMDSSCHISKIFLPDYNLTGVLPGEMFESLPNLTHLHVEGNFLQSPLPPEINQSSLVLLKIDGNDFSESLEVVGSISTLQVLIAYGNRLTGDLGPLQHLTNLSYLDIGSNSLTGSLETGKLNMMPGVTVIWLDNNYLSGDLSGVSQLVGLKRLYLEYNQFTGSIEHVQHLTNLERLELIYNQFTGSIEHVQYLTNLEYLWLSDNQFTGSIEHVQHLTNLEELVLAYNQFTGSIEHVQHLANLEILWLDLNQFTGSIEHVQNLTDLGSLDLSSNQFTGSLDLLTNLTSLQELDLYDNKITGDVDALTDLTYLTLLYLRGNLLSGSLEPLVGLVHLQYCILNNNLFTGSIPSLLNTSNMLMFTVEQNHLTGRLVPHGFPSSIEIIDVANNMLSGELPMEYFTFPNLRILSAGINCMTAQFSDAVCSATALSTLLLDGLHSASSCRSTVPVRVWDTIYASSQSVSSIPSCIYSLPTITNLHLSGNGITGSLPTDAILNDEFVELILSNNEYRSSIPEAFQDHKWEVFDLSYNKFSGLLLPSLDISISARLKINRLSGSIPTSLYNTTDVAALTGNLFSCTNDELIRLQDEVQDRYICGSEAFTNAGLLWFAVVVLVAVIIAVSFIPYSSTNTTAIKKWVATMLALLHDLRTRFVSASDYLSRMMAVVPTELKLSIDEVQRFAALSQTVRLATRVVTGVFVCVHLPLYCIFSSFFGTYSITYAWTASAAYLSGVAPGVILFLLYLGTIVGPCYYYRSYLRSALLHHHDDMTKSITSGNNVAAEGSDTDGINRRERNISIVQANTLSHKSSGTSIIGKETIGMVQKRFISMLIISTLNLIVVGTLDFTYVLVISSYNGTVVTLVDIGMGVFKAVWTNVVILEAMRLVDAHYIKSNKSEAEGRRLSLLSFTSILNNIVIPCIALTLASPDCFYNMIYSRDDVVSLYRVNIRALFDNYDYEISYKSDTTFTPPYAYSYQCSSAILTSYVVIFLYSALFGLLSQPLDDRINDKLTVIQEKLVTQSFLSSKGSGSTKVTSIIDEMPVPPTEIDVKSSSLSHNNIKRPPLDPTLYVLYMVTTIAGMLSFGCVFPFLSFILFLAVVGQTKYTEYRIGQYVESIITCGTLPFEDKVRLVSKLNDELRGIQHKFVRSLWQVVPYLGPFYGIFVFDIIGDASSMKDALFAPVILLVVSVVIYLVPYMYEANDPTMSEYSTTNRLSKVSQVSPEDGEGNKIRNND